MKLTEKRKRFIEEYMIDLNATQAAIRAGYSSRTAGYIAKELMAYPAVRAYRDELMQKMQNERIASAEEVLQYLTKLIRDEDVEEVTVVEGTGQGFSKARNVEKRLTPKDRLKAAELLGKRHGMFSDRQDQKDRVDSRSAPVPKIFEVLNELQNNNGQTGGVPADEG